MSDSDMSAETNVGQLIGAEFFGSMLVMLGGPGLMIVAGEVSPLAIAFGFGISMAISVGVIGAVANPMFSIALWVVRAIPRRELFSDLIGQFLGAIAGGFILFSLNGATRYTTGVNGWRPGGANDELDPGIVLAPFAELGTVLAAELLIATVLVVVVLFAIEESTPIGTSAGFIGAAYGLSTLFLLGVSGAGVNPARSLGAALFSDANPNALAQVWLFLLVPVVASFAGVFIWLGLHEATIDDTVFDDTVVDRAADRLLGDTDAELAGHTEATAGSEDQ